MSVAVTTASSKEITSASSAAAIAASSSAFLSDLQSLAPAVPLDFFTPQEEQLLRSIFQKTHLSNQLCLIDLIGFEFFHNLQTLIREIKVLRPNDSDIDGLGLQELFCGNFLALYLRLIRNGTQESLVETPPKIKDQFSLPKHRGIEMIDFILKTTNDVLAAARTAAIGEADKSQFKQQKEILIATHYRVALTHFIEMKQLNALFTKIVNSPHCQALLLDVNLSCFEGGSDLSRPTARAHIEGIKINQCPASAQMQQYLQYLQTTLRGLVNFGIGGINIRYFDVQRQLLSKNENLSVTPELIKAWNMNLHGMLEPLIGLIQQSTSDMIDIRQGSLTYKQWKTREGIRSKLEKNREEFLETQQMTFLLGKLIASWMEDVDQMAESHLFTPQIESYRSKNDMKWYFFNALHSLINLQPRKPIIERDSFDQLLNEFQEELQAANAPLSSFLANPYFAKFFAELKKATYSQLVTLMPRLTRGCELANAFLQQLPHIHQNQKAKLKAFLASVPTDTLNDQKELWKKRLAQMCSSEYKQAYGQIIYFKDVEIIHQKRDFLTEWDYAVPEELTAFFSLEELLNLIEEEAAKRKVLPPPELDVAPEKTPSPPPPVSVAEVAVRTPQDLAAELKTAKKRKDFQSILSDWDFVHVRTKGSHEIWKGPNGGQVVLPFHDGKSQLKPGTHHAVISQAVDAVEN
jgi:predicted RNA binding protein YcfA (HicA-like mRNA interferase family)